MVSFFFFSFFWNLIFGIIRGFRSSKDQISANTDLCGDVVGGQGFNLRFVRQKVNSKEWINDLKRWNAEIVILGSDFDPSACEFWRFS